jgi:hypothetical protein
VIICSYKVEIPLADRAMIPTPQVVYWRTAWSLKGYFIRLTSADILVGYYKLMPLVLACFVQIL